MALSCATIKVFSILPLLVILTFTPLSSSLPPTDKVTKELVSQLCSKPTVAKHFCIAWLTSDPKTYTLDLNVLIESVLEKTQAFNYKNLEMMKGLVTTTTDPALKIPYGHCVTDYELVVKEIEEAEKFASAKSYNLATKAASKAFNSVSSCECQLQGRKNVPSHVPRRNVMVKKMFSVIIVFSNDLTS